MTYICKKCGYAARNGCDFINHVDMKHPELPKQQMIDRTKAGYLIAGPYYGEFADWK